MIQPDWRERRCRVNGLDLHLVEAGRPGDPLVLLLHGFPEFWWAWRNQITPLAQAGYHVVAPDMRGYNRSDAPEGTAAYGLDVLAGDVAALARAMGAERFRLVGHDWGAVVGWWVAAHHSEVERAVLIGGPHPQAWASQVFRQPVQALRSAYIALFQLPWLPEALLRRGRFARLKAAMRRSARPGTFPPEVLDRYAEAWARPGRLTAMLNYYRGLRRAPSGPATRLSCPVMVIWGNEDRFLGRPVMEASLALCDHGRMSVIEGGTHWLHLEHAERVTAEIAEFLAAG